MRIHILIAASNMQAAGQLKNRLKGIAAFTEFDGFNFYCNDRMSALEQMAPELWRRFHLAFIDAGREDAQAAGALLYRHNPDCRLIYCGREDICLLPLLPTRPVWYWNALGEVPLKELFLHQLSAMMQDACFFSYRDKLRSLLIPYGDIDCFFSQNRAVYIHTSDDDIGPLPRTLDQIAEMVTPETFVRVHQSYLVNRAQVRRFARKSRSLFLQDGYEVPVSKTLVSQAERIFIQNDGFAGQNDRLTDKAASPVIQCAQEDDGYEQRI